jgi:hypothetical protein
LIGSQINRTTRIKCEKFLQQVSLPFKFIHVQRFSVVHCFNRDKRKNGLAYHKAPIDDRRNSTQTPALWLQPLQRIST